MVKICGKVCSSAAAGIRDITFEQAALRAQPLLPRWERYACGREKGMAIER